MSTAAAKNLMGGVASGTPENWLGRQDSNLRSRDQNPLPYHLATPHSGLAAGP